MPRDHKTTIFLDTLHTDNGGKDVKVGNGEEAEQEDPKGAECGPCPEFLATGTPEEEQQRGGSFASLLLAELSPRSGPLFWGYPGPVAMLRKPSRTCIGSFHSHPSSHF